MAMVNGILMEVDGMERLVVSDQIETTVLKTEENDLPLANVCRICLNVEDADQLLHLSDHSNVMPELSISAAVEYCFKVELNLIEGLPECVCVSCIHSLSQAYNLLKCLEESLSYWGIKEEGKVADDVVEIKEQLWSNLDDYDLDDEESEDIFADHDYCKVEDEEAAAEEEGDVRAVEGACSTEGLQKQETGGLKLNKARTTLKWWRKDLGPPYMCKICNRDFGMRYKPFISHIRTHWVKKQKCPFCPSMIAISKVKAHVQGHLTKTFHRQKMFVCNQCPARFTCAMTLNKHIEKAHHMGENRFMCDVCGKVFQRQSSFETHVERHGKFVKRFVCDYCGKIFHSEKHYNSHIQKHENEENDLFSDDMMDESEMDITEGEISIKNHDKESPQDSTDGSGVFPCEKCGKVFKKHVALAAHARVHERRKLYPCTMCDKTFETEANANVHALWHTLQDHEEQDSVVWPCNFCGTDCVSKNDLMNHILTHMEKPYQCNICGRSYISKLKLTNHYVYHSEKPYTCDVCDKKFVFRAILKQHMRIHTGEKPYNCEICNRGFAQQQQLISHRLTHTGEKKYVCPYCGKAFALNGNLTVHKRRHTGETPYMCQECGKGFYDSSSLKRHKQAQHKNHGETILEEAEQVIFMNDDDLSTYDLEVAPSDQ